MSLTVDSKSDAPPPAPRRTVRQGAALAVALILVVAVACGDPYRHTNPYDPIYPVTVTVVGPDTLFSYSQVGQYSGQSDPAFPDSAFGFGVTDSIKFGPAGVGAFIAYATPLWPAYDSVTVIVGVGAVDTFLAPPAGGTAIRQTIFRHAATKQVILTQRVTSIRLRCPDTHGCDTVGVGGTWSVWVDGRDALNQLIYALHSSVANPTSGTPVATYTIRDTTVATFVPVGIRAATVTALKTGTTWIVATRGALLDSLQLVVQ
jgi:hypothetical protein